jgi:hypothetical protein
MSFINRLLSNVAHSLHRLADSIKPTQVEPIQYFPPQPIGEIRSSKSGKYIQHYWYYPWEGKMERRYLSRDWDKAVRRREELYAELIQGRDITDKPEYSGLLMPFE